MPRVFMMVVTITLSVDPHHLLATRLFAVAGVVTVVTTQQGNAHAWMDGCSCTPAPPLLKQLLRCSCWGGMQLLKQLSPPIAGHRTPPFLPLALTTTFRREACSRVEQRRALQFLGD